MPDINDQQQLQVHHVREKCKAANSADMAVGDSFVDVMGYVIGANLKSAVKRIGFF